MEREKKKEKEQQFMQSIKNKQTEKNDNCGSEIYIDDYASL